MTKELFRKSALEKIASPEQLDLLLTVTSPKGWLALCTIGGLLLVALLWGIFGFIPKKAMGNGIIMKTGGLVDVVTESAGRVTMVYFQVGDVVHKGRVVARLAQPEMINRIQATTLRLENLHKKYELAEQQRAQHLKLEGESTAQQRANLKSNIASLEKRIKMLTERRDNQKQLAEEGILTKQTYLDTQFELNRTEQDLGEQQANLKKVEIKQEQIERDNRWELAELRRQIKDIESEVEETRANLSESDTVVSHYTGRVIEVVSKEGAVVGKATPIIKLELIGDSINTHQALVYFSATEGKKVKPGMVAQVSPSTVQKEEYGFVYARVWSVSKYPASREAMMLNLKNETLVNDFTKSLGAPIEARVLLIPDPNTPSGYQWSSSKGPSVELHSGTACQVTVVTSEDRPISLIFPLFKKHILGIGED
jgi:HlyD family secretion protein